jgi:hypothetical protein
MDGRISWKRLGVVCDGGDRNRGNRGGAMSIILGLIVGFAVAGPIGAIIGTMIGCAMHMRKTQTVVIRERDGCGVDCKCGK